MESNLSNFNIIKDTLLQNFQNGKLHHGLLFSGNKGIGKATFSLKLAQHILLNSSPNISDKNPYKPSNQNNNDKDINSFYHPDLLLIRKDEKKRDITIDAIRDINQFLNLTSSISQNRIIIIDAIDDLNRNSSNAILKNLEEPPKNVFLFLISHNPNLVLETIKSRCQILDIANPSFTDFQQIIKNNIKQISESEIEILGKLTSNSVGMAINIYNNDALEIYDQICSAINNNNQQIISNISKKILVSDDLWSIFSQLIIFYLYNQHLEKNLMNKERLFSITNKITNILYNTKNFNLDKSHGIINIFNIIRNG